MERKRYMIVDTGRLSKTRERQHVNKSKRTVYQSVAKIRRDSNGRFAGGPPSHGFQPGKSGNPAGRPPKHETLTSLYKEEIEKMCPREAGVPGWAAGKTWKELIVIATMKLAIQGNSTALKEVWERIDGKVPLPTTVALEGPMNIVVTYGRGVTQEEAAELAEKEYGVGKAGGTTFLLPDNGRLKPVSEERTQ